MKTADFSPISAARRVLRQAATGTLATLEPGGGPFASLVTVATTFAGEPILLLSALAVHTKNLAADSRASLLLVAPGGEGGDPLAGARLTLTGAVSSKDADPDLRRRFLARHPEARGYSSFVDFGFHRFEIAAGHLVAGFGRIGSLSRAELLDDVATATKLATHEEGALEHMNADHAEAIRLYATALLGLPDGEWQMSGIDPDGADLRLDGLSGRLDFPERVTSPAALRKALVDLAVRARSIRQPP
jgi:putative heme iron utilization protein